MHKTVVPVAIIALIIIVGGAVYLTHRNTASTSNTTSNMTMNTTGNSNNAAPSATDKVSLANFSFSPANITVKKGTVVTWTNNDSTTHTVTESDGQSGPNSGSLAPGGNYSFTYNIVGTFPYHCTIHPEMIGTVTVTE